MCIDTILHYSLSDCVCVFVSQFTHCLEHGSEEIRRGTLETRVEIRFSWLPTNSGPKSISLIVVHWTAQTPTIGMIGGGGNRGVG